jgi:signal transduction histidine kinase
MYIENMKIRQTYGSAGIIVVVAMVFILPLLAYLQYTWLGQISEREYERMRGSLQSAGFHCSMDFSREITDVMESLCGPLNGSDENVKNTVQARISHRNATSIYSDLISTGIRIASSPPPEQTVTIHMNEEQAIFLFRDVSALAVPMTGRHNRVVLVPFNLEYISSTLLPKIIETNFSSSTRSEYDIVVTNALGNCIYSSADTAKHGVLPNADLVLPFLTLPSTPSSFMPPQRPNHDRMSQERENPPEPFGRNPRDFKRRLDVPPPQEHLAPGAQVWRMGDPSLFKLCMKHREGSLEIAVNNNRLRNLGISFGVLILLGASIIVLLLSTHRARRLAQQQMEFVAGITHELRTPLAVLKSAGENLADGVIQEKGRTRKYGELIKNEVMRLSDMVEKALEYAGIQSGKRRYELHPLDIKTIITDAIRNAKKLFPARDVTIKADIDRNLPRVLGDGAALQSAIENLIVNGIKYSFEKKWISISAHPMRQSQGSYIEIEVKDQGIGISASDISNIFKPFYRGQNAMEGQIQGSGLGLNITRHIVEAHSGTISVTSALHEGSVFTIILPSLIKNEEHP